MTRPQPYTRSGFLSFHDVQTRWMDNDVYGHVNNVVYYAYFDSCVNGYLIEKGLLDFERGETVGLVVHSSCSYFAPLSFPQKAVAGLRVLKIGRSSVEYEIAIFIEGEEGACAQGTFTHVYVDRMTRRPVPLSEKMRAALRPLVTEEGATPA
ncbi:thioesterase family protein [Pseudovibrio exalbescens]|uniref:acyl-CoA thioesterase n=1 Tax=Pseudovibrio exalbescens TaxID=197461 RepID=UPI0023654002|nr:thioesterase family protein [Pseudovibrio exalbescens]MDD7910560.1 thioesterase family protein [Pseudovibrio exalbescens]